MKENQECYFRTIVFLKRFVCAQIICWLWTLWFCNDCHLPVSSVWVSCSALTYIPVSSVWVSYSTLKHIPVSSVWVLYSTLTHIPASSIWVSYNTLSSDFHLNQCLSLNILESFEQWLPYTNIYGLPFSASGNDYCIVFLSTMQPLELAYYICLCWC